jgi:toxin CptA
MHGLGLAALLLTPLGLGVRIAAGVMIVVGFGLAWRCHVERRGRRGIRMAVWTNEGGWQVTDGTGRDQVATLMPDFHALPAVVILNLRLAEGGRRSLVLPADTVEADTLRRLRVRLRLAGRRQDEPMS